MKLSGQKTDKNDMDFQESLDSGEYARAFAIVYNVEYFIRKIHFKLNDVQARMEVWEKLKKRE